MDNIFTSDSGVVELKSNNFTRREKKEKKRTIKKIINNNKKKKKITIKKIIKNKKKNKNVNLFLKKSIRGDKRGLILFYTPWCKSCENFKYKWSEIALLFKNRFFIGAVNVENSIYENEIVRSQLKIKSYPTIMFVTKTGKVSIFKGSRDINEITEFICKKEKIDCEK